MSEAMPPDAVLALVKAVLEYLRGCAKALGGASNLDLFARSYLVMAVVLIGEEEGRPVTVPDVANYTGMSRSTVQRELANLKRLGLLITRKEGRRRVILRDPETKDRTYDECMTVVHAFVTTVSNILPKG